MNVQLVKKMMKNAVYYKFLFDLYHLNDTSTS